MSREYKIAVVPGDGIGQEIVPAGLWVIEAAAKRFDFSILTKEFSYGAGYYKAKGFFMDDDALEQLKDFDAIYFGAVGLPDVDDTLPAKQFTFKIRNAFKQYVNYRPARLLKGIEGPLRFKSPEEIDFVVIRENNEGEFVQMGGIFQPESPHGFATETSVFTRQGTEKIAHYSFQLARRRRKKVTNITKSNTLIHSLAYWDRVIEEVSRSYPDVTFDKMYIDNGAASFILRPERFDVILTTNLFGDILSDLGGAITGSLGLGASGNINPEREFPSMFEPIHGSAPDIAGRGIANPIGTIWSGALMFDFLGEQDAAALIVGAIEKTVEDGVLTVDLGGQAKTVDVAKSVVEHIQNAP